MVPVLALFAAAWLPAQAPRLEIEGDSDHRALGSSVAWLGDLDGDGVADFAAGAYCMLAKLLNDNPVMPKEKKPTLKPGVVHVLSGKDGRLLGLIEHEDTDYTFGTDTLSPGDLDGDGCLDLVVLASYLPSVSMVRALTIGPPSGRAQVHAYSGKTRQPLWDVRVGQPLVSGSGCEDVNRDGRRELVVCSSGTEDEAPEVALISGKDGGTLWKQDLARPATFAESNDQNSDKVPDVFAGQPRSSSEKEGAGYVLLLSGADGKELWRVRGKRQVAGFGEKLCAVGDLNADGRADVGVGEGARDQGGPSYVCILSGSDGSLLREIDLGQEVQWIRSMTAVPDMDADEHRDIAVSSTRRIQVFSSGSGKVLFGLEGHELGGGIRVGVPANVDLLVGDPVHPDSTRSRGVVRVHAHRGPDGKK